MEILTIDIDQIQGAMPCDLRLEVAGNTLAALAQVEDKATVNWQFFGHLQDYAGRHTALSPAIQVAQDLWAPDIAALDYVLHNISKTASILDFACGLGNLLVYLSHAGYDNLHGYDNWSQLPRSAAQDFLDLRGISGCLVDDLPELVDVIIFTGGHWCWFWDNWKEWLADCGAHHFLLDASYCPPAVLGFEHVATYEKLLNVYVRD